MAVTGAIFNSLTFGGVNSADYGIYITGEGVFNAPKRAVNMVAVPGRNGSIAIDQGHWENIEVTYPAGTFGMDEQEFRTALSNFRNAIASQVGYQRLTDTYHPDEYRMALYSEGLEVEPTTYNKAGEFDLKFDCKPQRWLTAGEVPVTIGEWGATKTASGEIVTIESEGGEIAKSLEVSLEPIQDLNGYDAPWIGGAGKNKLLITATTQTINGVTFTVNNDGTVTANGTATADAVFYLNKTTDPIEIPAGQYCISGITGSTQGSWTTFMIGWGDYSLYNPAGRVISLTGAYKSRAYIKVGNGYSVNNMVFKPMIELGSAKTSYEPYENICPISGRTSVETTRTGKNLAKMVADGMTPSLSNGNLVSYPQSTHSQYIKVIPSASYTASFGNTLINGVFQYDANKNFVRVDQTASTTKTVTTASNTAYIMLRCDRTAVADPIPLCQLEAGTEATDYEPYNGQTYTTALGRTVYGGTLDVVSGELAVTWVAIEPSAWTYDSGSGRWSAVLSPTPKPTGNNRSAEVIAEAYETNTSVQQGGIGCFRYSTAVYVYSNSSTTPPTGKFCYPLATPQTYQLTAQEVTLLVGENHLWSDGSITMQYGDDPDSLWNPTRYDAGPLLITDGYGTINFNGYDIEITHVPVGWVTLVNRGEKYLTTALPNASGQYSVKWNSELLQRGDTINVASRADRAHKITFGVSNLTALDTYTYSNSNPNAIDTLGVIGFAFDNVSFTAGTANTITNTLTVTPTGSGSSASWTGSISYDGDSTITFSISKASTDNFRFEGEGYVEWDSIESNSTAQAFGRPTYIDCELGEAYKIENDEIISLNKYLDLGSDLPKLSPGANDVTTDNTITELKVVPNWWKL